MSDPRILVVDDDQVIQQLLKVNLELEGYAVEVASDGQEALALFAAFEPDLVLLDIMMPKLDGIETLKRLKADASLPFVPVILLTAKAEPETLALVRPGGWRKAATLTPGLVKDALARRFRDFEAFRLLPTTRGKSGPVRGTRPPERVAAA